MEPIIVGIDPGTTTGLAIIDFSMKPLKVKSKKNYSPGELIKDVYEVGYPLIVATDKKEVPSFIKEFSMKTGSRIYAPRYDTKKGEKKHAVDLKGMAGQVKNAHETDALASAIMAFNEYSSLIKKITSYASKHGKESIRDQILQEVISEDKSIAQAVMDIESVPLKRELKPKRIPSIITKELSEEEKQIMLLKMRIETLEQELDSLKEENSKLKEIDIDKELRKTLSFKERRALDFEQQNSRLRFEITNREKIITKLNAFIGRIGNHVLLKKVKNLGEDYKKKKGMLSISSHDIILVEDITVVGNESVSEFSGRIIIYEEGSNRLLEESALLIKKGNIIAETKYYALASSEELDKAVEKVRKQRKSREFIEDIIDEYKRTRFNEK